MEQSGVDEGSEVEAAIARGEQATNLLCWQQHLETAIEAEMTGDRREQAFAEEKG